MSGNYSRRKGYQGEKLFRDMAEAAGFEVVWQAEDPKKPDVRIDNFNVEVKYRGSVSSQIYEWLNEKSADILAVKRVNREERPARPWLMIMTWDKFLSILGGKKCQPTSTDAQNVEESKKSITE